MKYSKLAYIVEREQTTICSLYFFYLISKIVQKEEKWQEKLLSQVGKGVLAKAQFV